jgi:hypothetical protein
LTSTHYKALDYTIKAFKLRKVKYDTLVLCFEQIKPILERYMEKNQIPYVRVDLKTKEALIVEPIPNAMKQWIIEQWLNNQLSNEDFKKWLGYRFQNTHYLNFADFLQNLEGETYGKS